jgi:hypothetical protein
MSLVVPCVGAADPELDRLASWMTGSFSSVIHAHGMVSWDRGFNDAGMQVWGAEKAGYRFERVAADEQASDPR